MSVTQRIEGVAGREILLVEDDPGDALLVEELLRSARADLRTIPVASLSEAAERISRSTACVLLDLNLPDAEGLDSLLGLLGVAPDVPVIVLTGFADRALGEAAVAAGAQDYLVKGSVDGEGLARAIGYAVERKRGEETARRLREAELLRAENARLERGLLPRPMITNPALSWATRYQPGGRRTLLGGDFYDAVETPDGTLRVLVGDVTGHGPDEAALGVALRVAWRTLVLAGAAAGDALRNLQRVLVAERHAEYVFATACDLTIRPDLRSGEVRLAGHPAPLLLSADGGVGELDDVGRGPMLGIVEEAGWPGCSFDLGDDWAVLVFTDGIIEGRAAETGRLDIEGLAALAEEAVGKRLALGALADHLIAGAEDANGGPLTDDIALFLVSTGDPWRR